MLSGKKNCVGFGDFSFEDLRWRFYAVCSKKLKFPKMIDDKYLTKKLLNLV